MKPKKQKTNPQKVMLSMSEVRKVLNEARKQITNEVFVILIAVTAMTLHDEFGFGKRRLEIFVEQACRKYNDLDAGLYSVEDAKHWFEEYTGMVIQKID